MDRAKLLAQMAVLAGLAFVWPGPEIASRLEIGSVVEPQHRVDPPPLDVPVDDAQAWYAEMKSSCNSVEVDVRLRQNPAPSSFEGQAYEAACLALAGRLEAARAGILELPPDRRAQAVGVVFDQAHPAADAGDDVAAGPVMELVVEFWPNHYMALYHAGAARYERGDYPAAQAYLTRFLENYRADDGWTEMAEGMLREIAAA